MIYMPTGLTTAVQLKLTRRKVGNCTLQGGRYAHPVFVITSVYPMCLKNQRKFLKWLFICPPVTILLYNDFIIVEDIVKNRKQAGP